MIPIAHCVPARPLLAPLAQSQSAAPRDRVAVSVQQAPLGVQKSPLQVGRSQFLLCTLADLEPGDLAFQYQKGQRNFNQTWIGVGTYLANIWNPRYRTDTSVMHSFVVIKANPAARTLYTVDAAGGNLEDISECCMNFETGDRVVPGAQYFFYRAVNPQTRRRIVRIARNWAAPGLHNFSVKHAAISPFRPFTLRQKGCRRALHLLQQAQKQAPLRRPHSNVLYRMMCSEFVVNVCIAATLMAWRQDHPHVHNDAGILRGLSEGEMGDTFAVDAKGITPSIFQRRLQDCPGVRTVGYFNQGD